MALPEFENEVDILMYELYNLTSEEVCIVEKATG